MKIMILVISLFFGLEVYAKSCQAKFSLPNKENLSKKVQSGISFFHPENPMEEYILSFKERWMSLKVTQYLTKDKDPSKGSIIYKINCSANLSCSGKRVYKSQLRDETEEFNEESEKFSSNLLLDKRNISSFSTSSNQMNLYFHKYHLKGKNIGVHFLCGEKK